MKLPFPFTVSSCCMFLLIVTSLLPNASLSKPKYLSIVTHRQLITNPSQQLMNLHKYNSILFQRSSVHATQTSYNALVKYFLSQNTNTTSSSIAYSSQTILNYFNIQYYGTIYIGSPMKQKMTVVYDTGSNLLWVPSQSCTQCRSYTAKYNSMLSDSARYTNEKKNITYALGFVSGDVIEETVALGDGAMSVEGFRMIMVTEEKELNGTIADGVLGLGINMENNVKNSLIYSLYRANVITKPSFTFYLTETKKDSRLFIGDILENSYIKKVLSTHKVFSCEVPVHETYWMCQLNEISIEDMMKRTKPVNTNANANTNMNIENAMNNNSNNNSATSKPSMSVIPSRVYYTSSSKVIFDSGTSYIIIPSNDFLAIIEFLMAKSKYENGGKCGLNAEMQLICQCSSPKDFGKLVLHFNENTTFEIVLEDIIDYFPTLEYQCHFQILADMFFNDTWILGDSALRSTLITFDMQERTVQWIQMNKRLNEDEMIKDDNENYDNAIYYTWVVVAIAFLVILGFLAYCFLK